MSKDGEKKNPTSPAGDDLDSAQGQFMGELMGTGSLDKVRDILFGANMRDYEKRFSRVEERLLKESTDLKNDMKKRFDALEAYVKKEIESLNDRIKSEHDERAENGKGLAQEFKDLGKNLDKRITQLDDQVNKGQRELRERMLEQTKSLSEESQQHYQELSLTLEKAIRELRNDKTDRYALASLFTELAMRLNNQLKVPGFNSNND